MEFDASLRKLMLLKGLNQQMLARASCVSDSEISRILSGKSKNLGLKNALRLARAMGVSLDYLVAGDQDEDPIRAGDLASVGLEVRGIETEILEAAHEIGIRRARRILETTCDLGYDTAMRRLLEMESEIEVIDPSRQTVMVEPRRNSLIPGDGIAL